MDSSDGIAAVDTAAYKPIPKDYESRMTEQLKGILEHGQLRADNLARMRETYLALNIQPNLTRYGWMRAEA